VKNTIFFLLAISLFHSVHPIFKSALNFCKLTSANISSLCNVRYQFKILGDKDVSLPTQEFVRSILRTAGISSPEKVYIKQMSPFLKRYIGGDNALATHNAIFIDEDTIRNWSDNRKRFHIAHEAIHVKKYDCVKSLFGFISTLLMAVKYPLTVPINIFGMFLLRRYQEKRSDTLAAQLVPGAAHGGIEDLNYYKGAAHNLFSSHPSIASRITNLEKITGTS